LSKAARKRVEYAIKCFNVEEDGYYSTVLTKDLADLLKIANDASQTTRPLMVPVWQSYDKYKAAYKKAHETGKLTE
jgi:hypothetical protein